MVTSKIQTRILRLYLFSFFICIYLLISSFWVNAALENCSPSKTDYKRGDKCINLDEQIVDVPLCSATNSNSYCYSGESYTGFSDVDTSTANNTRVDGTVDPVTTPAESARPPCGTGVITNCYTLLEPLGGKGSDVDKSVIIEKGGLEKYLNGVFVYLLMIIVVVAVFYMIYGGILYLTTDIINKKMEGKEVIQRVVVGLIFVFSVWTIMNTINPNLLKSSLDFSGVIGALSSPPEDSETYNTPPPSASNIRICLPADVVVVRNIKVCKDVAVQFESMLAAASAAGITLTKSGEASGWRSNEQQIALRIKNCGGASNINNRAARCSPLTALPGESNHQGGHAVDFKEARTRDTAAYRWLSENAASYGYKNQITSEPWHWSRTGR